MPGLSFGSRTPAISRKPRPKQACAAILNDAERARAARFRFARHRREYLATHALARDALSHAHPLPPDAWSFSVNQYGKPSPIPECGLRFNQSNSVELAVCLVARPDAQPESGTRSRHRSRCRRGAFARAEEIVPLAAQVFSSPNARNSTPCPPPSAPIARCRSGPSRRPTSRRAAWGFRFRYAAFRSSLTDLRRIRLEVDAGVDDDPCRWRFCRS